MATKEDENEIQPQASLSDSDIKTTRQRERRSFLKTVGIGVAGAAALVLTMGSRGEARDDDPSDGRDSDTADNGGPQHDFPKGSSDGDETVNKDLKARDSDSHNAKETDSDENRLRDVKRSGDSD